MSDEINLGEYYDALLRHDWWYMMSDDNRVSERGYENESRLLLIADRGPEFKDLWERFLNWKRRDGPKVERP